MKCLVPFLFCSALGLCYGEPDYSLQFCAQLARQDFSGMERTLKDWRKSQPTDVDWFAAQGNYFYLLAQKGAPVLSQPAIVETPVVWCPTAEPPTDPPGKNPSYFNRPLVSRAVTCWQTAIASHPQRLDFSLNLAQLYQEMGNFDAQYDVLAN